MLSMIRKTIIEFVDIDEEKITEETNFITDLSINSYDFANIIGKFEDNLGIEIPRPGPQENWRR